MATAQPLATIPFPLGKIAPPNAGTPLKITNNFTDMDAFQANSVMIQALASNTNPIYVLAQVTATGKDTTNYTNIVGVLTAGQSMTFNGKYGNQITLGRLWIDPTTNGEGVFVVIQAN